MYAIFSTVSHIKKKNWTLIFICYKKNKKNSEPLNASHYQITSVIEPIILKNDGAVLRTSCYDKKGV